VLTHLDLTFNQVTDAGTLAGCPAVEQLSLGANPLTDLTPLLELPSLIGVDLSETDPAGLTGIDELRARGVYVGGLA
jgi:Leucine-rich repeat (LRR) protein